MTFDLIFRLLAATVCGALIGIERELHGRVAGLRTHILVCVGACLMTLVSIYIARQYGGETSDPARIAAQVVSGIGFLGAGTIIRFRASIKGLTTAASLWAVAGIGLACGVGFYGAVVPATGIILAVLFLVSKLEKTFIRKKLYQSIVIELSKPDAQITAEVKKILTQFPVDIINIKEEKNSEGRVRFIFKVNVLTQRYNRQIEEELIELNNVANANFVDED